MGGSLGFTKSRQDQQSFIDPAQSPFLQQLRAGGQGLQQSLQQQFQGLGGFAQQLGQQGQGFIDQLGAGGPLSQFIGQGTTDQQIAGVQGFQENFLNQQLNQLEGTSNLAGQFGGGRQSVAEGAAIGQASAGFGQTVAQILGQDIQRRQNAALGAGQQAVQGIGGLSSLFGLEQGGLQGQFGGLGLLAGLIGQPTVLGQSSGRSLGVDTSGGVFFTG